MTTDSRLLRTHPGVLRVRTALQEQETHGQMVVFDEAVRTADAAAAALGVEVGQIASSLLFRAHHRDGAWAPLLVMTSGAHRVDLIKLGEILDLDRVDSVDAEFVRQHTGFAIGGVAPVGHPEGIQTVVDITLGRYDEVWAAGGHPRVVFATTYDELLRITAGQAAEVA